ncbi:uncharacterized protein DFL_008011 [Arthrobotrys flagrans]|uniref:Late embryogenesis abundant protein LEA-2 subgroup domain-containing protein n=1 Tax=Arthrobotrys flagrans TaxID=97331 RepID=A0A436ZXJ4_ARTFL|nr:hypothetical protein DFL_008011 [Arthrobotrys flagrans]
MYSNPDIEKTHGPTSKGHFARRWWIYLIVFSSIVVLVTLLVVIFVVVPAIAQDSVDGATVQVDGIAITNPKVSEITVSMNSTVKAQVPVGGARLSPQTFEMYLPSADDSKNLPSAPTFATLTVGELPVKDIFTINVTGSETAILNQDIFREFSNQVLKNEVINLGLRANPAPNIGIGPLKFPVNFRKIVQLKGEYY